MNTLSNLSLKFSYAFITFVSAPRAYAQALFGEIPDIGGVGEGGTEEVRTAILDVLDIILSFMALIAVVIIVIAGVRLVVSQGEEGEKDKAKKTIFYAILGLIVILIAQAIVSFIADIANQVDS